MVGLRIVFQKVSKKRKIDKCAEIMPFRGKYGLRHTWWIDGLRIVFQNKKIDESKVIALWGKHAGRVWLMVGLMIEYRVTKNGVLVEGRQLLLWGVLMLPFRGKHAVRVWLMVG